MKTLKTIQVLAKIGKIISNIVFICSIVGFCLCVLGIVSLAAGGTLIKIGGVTVRGLIENNAGIPLPELYASMIVGVFICAAEAVLSKFAGIYFKNELEAGTPFTFEGTKELSRSWNYDDRDVARLPPRNRIEQFRRTKRDSGVLKQLYAFIQLQKCMNKRPGLRMS